MAIIALREILDIIIVTLALGYIFMGQIRRPKTHLDLLKPVGFSFEDFKFAALITAPAIILHEMAHKFFALFFGISATFKAWFVGLAIGVLLSIIKSPLIILAPGYVQIEGGSDLQQTIIAFAGPFLNLLLFLLAKYVLEHKKRLSRNEAIGWYLTKQINIFLFVFNLLPIPPLDGSKVFAGLIKLIF